MIMIPMHSRRQKVQIVVASVLLVTKEQLAAARNTTARLTMKRGVPFARYVDERNHHTLFTTSHLLSSFTVQRRKGSFRIVTTIMRTAVQTAQKVNTKMKQGKVHAKTVPVAILMEWKEQETPPSVIDLHVRQGSMDWSHRVRTVLKESI